MTRGTHGKVKRTFTSDDDVFSRQVPQLKAHPWQTVACMKCRHQTSVLPIKEIVNATLAPMGDRYILGPAFSEARRVVKGV